MKLKSYGHAAFQITTDSGTRLLTDPWLYGPIYGNMMWQFPQVAVSLSEFTDQDAVYISHDHPDHFCERTLEHFRRDTRIFIRRYPSFVPLRAILTGMGFETVIELDDRESAALDATTTLTLLADPINTDSALIVADGKHTILNQNDCKLNETGWRWVGENFSLDLSIQCYGATNLFPAAYVMSDAEKVDALARRTKHQLDGAIRCGELIGSPLVIPAANDLAYPSRPDLDDYYAALPIEFAAYARAKGAPFSVLLLNPGDVYTFAGETFEPHFANRAEFLAGLYRERESHSVQKYARGLGEWETSFEFDADKFEDLFARYVAGAKSRAMTMLPPTETIRVGLSIEGAGAVYDYRLTYCPAELEFGRAVRRHADDRDLFMIVSVPGNLMEMAMRGAYLFEDLMNCRWQVRRFGQYGPTEASFWAFLTAFSNFLLECGEQPERPMRNSRKMLPDAMVTSIA